MLESTLLPDFYKLEYTLLPRSNRSALLIDTYFSNYGGSLIAHIFLITVQNVHNILSFLR